MPEQRTLERAREAEREGKAPSTQAGEFVREEMELGDGGSVSAGRRIGVVRLTPFLSLPREFTHSSGDVLPFLSSFDVRLGSRGSASHVQLGIAAGVARASRPSFSVPPLTGETPVPPTRAFPARSGAVRLRAVFVSAPGDSG